MRFFEFAPFEIDESIGTAGAEYEAKVYGIIASAGVPGLDAGDKPAAGYSAHGAGDIEATYNGKPFNVEVKLNSKAQMGSGVVKYDRASDQFLPSQALLDSADPGDLALIIEALRSKKQAIDGYLDNLATIEPIALHAAAAKAGLPVVASKEALIKLKADQYLKAINSKISVDAAHIARIYNRKKVFYIQIGGAGLFFLGSNPLNLPVPEFTGQAQIEIRLKPAGDTSGAVTRAFNKRLGNADEPIQARRSDIICAARLIGGISGSKFTLDSPESIKELFGASAELSTPELTTDQQ